MLVVKNKIASCSVSGLKCLTDLPDGEYPNKYIQRKTEPHRAPVVNQTTSSAVPRHPVTIKFNF